MLYTSHPKKVICDVPSDSKENQDPDAIENEVIVHMPQVPGSGTTSAGSDLLLGNLRGRDEFYRGSLHLIPSTRSSTLLISIYIWVPRWLNKPCHRSGKQKHARIQRASIKTPCSTYAIG